MTTISDAPRRKDAQRNREAILAAARELFAESADVPMYEIARRAGVGQATLYRNFPDQRELAAALLDEGLGHLEQLAETHAADPDAFFVLLRSTVDSCAYMHALSELAQQDACLGSRLEACRHRVEELLTGPLCAAKAAGRLRRDVTLDDLFTVLSMVRGAASTADGPAARAAAASRALTLVVDGLAPPPIR
ncbi:MAG: TetR/AcrR family transcriptional regulator [Solirubrobacterales bacterium]|nr:TetR/AcrR family transcriptional regulator [Solirubrobacterales bacterium]